MADLSKASNIVQEKQLLYDVTGFTQKWQIPVAKTAVHRHGYLADLVRVRDQAPSRGSTQRGSSEGVSKSHRKGGRGGTEGCRLARRVRGRSRCCLRSRGPITPLVFTSLDPRHSRAIAGAW